MHVIDIARVLCGAQDVLTSKVFPILVMHSEIRGLWFLINVLCVTTRCSLAPTDSAEAIQFKECHTIMGRILLVSLLAARYGRRAIKHRLRHTVLLSASYPARPETIWDGFHHGDGAQVRHHASVC